MVLPLARKHFVSVHYLISFLLFRQHARPYRVPSDLIASAAKVLHEHKDSVIPGDRYPYTQLTDQQLRVAKALHGKCTEMTSEEVYRNKRGTRDKF